MLSIPSCNLLDLFFFQAAIQDKIMKNSMGNEYIYFCFELFFGLLLLINITSKSIWVSIPPGPQPHEEVFFF